ncbi:MAG: hypothetical protein JST22_20960 [Bacteroidetes bacterium]|nr:hypothetical protein [Bacteroidota bacterium]
MRSTTMRTFPAFAAAMLLAIAGLFVSSAANAQCTSLTVSNNVSCDLRLCLFRSNTVATVCVDVPAGGTVVLALPPGFVPDGGVSRGGNRYRFTATGCTLCYEQITSTVVPCCAEVCYDPVACTININPCTSAVCGK